MSPKHHSLLEERVTISRFQAGFEINEAQIAELIRLATKAPSAYHLQNWSFLAVKSTAAKQKLRELSYNQAQVSDAAVTFLISGTLAAHQTLSARLQPSVDAGILSPEVRDSWQKMAVDSHEGNPQLQRDEAIRSASFAAMALLVAARESGFDTGVVGGFDAEGVREAFDLSELELPVVLVTVGLAAPDNWPQKIRRQISEVLRVV